MGAAGNGCHMLSRCRSTTLPRQIFAPKSQIFATKSIDKLISDSERPEHALRKTLGPVSLTALGIGMVIGSGIFTVIGVAIGGNPAIAQALPLKFEEGDAAQREDYGEPSEGPFGAQAWNQQERGGQSAQHASDRVGSRHIAQQRSGARA